MATLYIRTRDRHARHLQERIGGDPPINVGEFHYFRSASEQICLNYTSTPWRRIDETTAEVYCQLPAIGRHGDTGNDVRIADACSCGEQLSLFK